jgi:hypothetical protein
MSLHELSSLCDRQQKELYPADSKSSNEKVIKLFNVLHKEQRLMFRSQVSQVTEISEMLNCSWACFRDLVITSSSFLHPFS